MDRAARYSTALSRLPVASWGDTDHFGGNQPEPSETVRTIFVRVANETLPSYAPVHATPITSTTFSIESVHQDFSDVALEFGAGESVRCKIGRLRGPSESTGRQRMIAVERVG
jgi:hypothetical protein